MYLLAKFLLLLHVFQAIYGIPHFDVIINGTIAKIQNYPYYAFIANKNKSLKCGGAIIKPNVILTAAHCLPNSNLHVYTGIQALDDLRNHQPYRVKQVIKYPKYKGQVGYDIGLVILSTPIRLTPTVKVIEIANTSPRMGSNLTVVGFGAIRCDGPGSGSIPCQVLHSEFLRSAVIKVIKYKHRIIHTKGSSQNTCYGDSGSPVVYKNRVVGLVSSGEHANCSGYDIQVAHSCLPTDRVFERVERELRRHDRILLGPTDYINIYKKCGHVHELSKDWVVYDLKDLLSVLCKYLGISEQKIVSLKKVAKHNTKTHAVTIVAQVLHRHEDPSKKSKIRGKSLTNAALKPVTEKHKISSDKGKAVNNLLIAAFGQKWRLDETLKWYHEILIRDFQTADEFDREEAEREEIVTASKKNRNYKFNISPFPVVFPMLLY
ncbi:Trypsin [Popillia japonica]|uniref:Trypsin n=1 Tax=Popillia japonica TaxID=7064 RepID=A0AAW1JCH5_POPJA